MRILQLCCFNNDWSASIEVVSIDIRTGTNVFSISPSYVQQFDFVIGAPPCTQFSKANCNRWVPFPREVLIAQQVFKLCMHSKTWLIENPPGRIEKFLPGLSLFRIMTFQDPFHNKESVLYSNRLFIQPFTSRYGKTPHTNNRLLRLKFSPGLIPFLESQLF
jgi:site-specific DNA-cytosine methylase